MEKTLIRELKPWLLASVKSVTSRGDLDFDEMFVDRPPYCIYVRTGGDADSAGSATASGSCVTCGEVSCRRRVAGTPKVVHVQMRGCGLRSFGRNADTLSVGVCDSKLLGERRV